MLIVFSMLLVCVHGPAGCCSPNVTVVAGETTTLPPTLLEYTTSIVDSEFIVMFTSYYTSDARDGFISAALRPFQDWTILPRSNPSTDYPSDFSVVQLNTAKGLRALSQHPAVKKVTPQKRLTQMLTSGDGESH